MRAISFAIVLLAAIVPVACGGDSQSTKGTGGRAGSGGKGGSTGGNAGSSGKGGSGGKGGSAGGGVTGGSAGVSQAGESGEGGAGGEGGSALGGEAGQTTAGGTGGSSGAGNGGSSGAGAGGSSGSGGSSGRRGSGGSSGSAGAGGTSGSSGAGAGGTSGAGAGGTAGAGAGGTAGTGGGAGALVCPEGTSVAVYQASGLPLPIVDNMQLYPTVATVTLSGEGLISTMAVQTSITHTYDSDLDIQLVGAFGSVYLSTDNGSDGNNYTDTVFVDSATESIVDGAAPFTGAYRPEEPLSLLSGSPLDGSFELRVGDDAAGDSGSLTDYSLAVCQCLFASGDCEFGPLACENGIDDDGDNLTDCEEADCAASDSCPALEHDCSDGVDNDGSGQADCNDANCAWACDALGSACTNSQRLFAYSTRSVPRTIPQTGIGSFFAPIFAAPPGTFVAAAVRFNATHTYAEDIELQLASPEGTNLVLIADAGGSGDNFVDTILIESGAGVIGSTGYNMAPFTGSYQPLQPFTAWVGESASGVWQGVVFDRANGDGGTFEELSLALCVED
jgi:subtilisin-like proprotein convertase family protein